MGIYDRDYARTSVGARFAWKFDGSVVKLLIGINIAVFVLQLLSSGGTYSATNLLALTRAAVFSDFQVYRLITYAFCHDTGSLWHIVFNMLVLWWFGGEIERMYGPREFAWFYLVSALVSGLAFLAIDASQAASPASALGASGALMAIMMLFALHFPHRTIYVFGIVPAPIWVLVMIYVLVDLYPLLMMLKGESTRDGIAHSAHLGGLAFGYAYYKANWRIARLFGDWSLSGFWKKRPRFGRKPNLRVYREESEPRPARSEPADSKVDELLEKISKQGEASLTDEERRTLFEASRRYRERRR